MAVLKKKPNPAFKKKKPKIPLQKFHTHAYINKRQFSLNIYQILFNCIVTLIQRTTQSYNFITSSHTLHFHCMQTQAKKKKKDTDQVEIQYM